jgi:ParB-like chromosome segregation protein Spo0J
MKEKWSTFFESAQGAGTFLKQKAAGVSQAALERTISAIEKWLEEFPKIEGYGLQVTNFAFVMGLSPALEVELSSSHVNFPPEKLAEILAAHKSGSLTGMVFSAIKTAYRLHAKIAQTLEEPLIVKIRLSLSPEISVFVGKPFVC